VDGTEELIDSDYEEDSEILNKEFENNIIITEKENNVTMPWLLEYILKNLRVVKADTMVI